MQMNSFVLFLLGTLLRIGIPVAVTILVIVLLRRLDQRWQKQSLALPVVSADVRPCWEVKGCSAEKRKGCPAAAKPDVPCWQTFRSRTGTLREACLDCDVFQQAPVPVNI